MASKKNQQRRLQAVAPKPSYSAPPSNRMSTVDPKPEVEGELTHCPACSSTERTGYTNKIELHFEGEHNGKPYNYIVWRDTQCTACCQARRDKHFENRTT